MAGRQHNWRPRLENRAYTDNVAKVSQREQLVSWMNDTRWGALYESSVVSLSHCEYRCRCLGGDIADDDLWAPWAEFLPPFAVIEWLELEPRRIAPETSIERLAAELRRLRVRFTIEGGRIRVWGYSRPGETPAFDLAPCEVDE